MAWTTVNPVTVGNPTKKSDFDKIWDNADYIKAWLAQFALNVKSDYGAVGNGVTDDSVSIQNAITAAGSGGTVFFPYGIYLANNLTWDKDVNLIGIGMGLSTLKSSSGNPLISLSNATMTEMNSRIEGLTLDGNSVGTIGLVATLCARFDLQRVEIKNFTTMGLDNNGSLIFRLNNCKLNNNIIGMDNDTFSSSRPNLIVLRDCEIRNNTTYGIQHDNGALFIAEGCEFGGNGTAANAATGGMIFTSSAPASEGITVIIDKCWSEGDNGHSFVRFGAPSGVVALNIIRDSLVIAGTRTYGIYCEGVNSKLECDRVTAQNAGTVDIYTDSNTSSSFIRCVASNATLGGIVTGFPLPQDPRKNYFQSYSDSYNQFFGTIVNHGLSGTMTNNETFDLYDGNIFIKDPGFSPRTFNPSGSFVNFTQITVINSGGSTLTFDSTGLNQAIATAERGIFVYYGGSWIKVFVG